jgi:hypothetical protein
MLRSFLVAGVAIVAAVVPAQASAWQSNVFQSPSGNIRCKHYPASMAIVCATAVPRRSVRLDLNGVRRGNTYMRRSGPVLRYGQVWYTDENEIICGSREDGIACFTEDFGFRISKERLVIDNTY